MKLEMNKIFTINSIYKLVTINMIIFLLICIILYLIIPYVCEMHHTCNIKGLLSVDRKVLMIVLGIRGKKKRSYGSPLFAIFRICKGKNCIQLNTKHLVKCT